MFADCNGGTGILCIRDPVELSCLVFLRKIREQLRRKQDALPFTLYSTKVFRPSRYDIPLDLHKDALFL